MEINIENSRTFLGSAPLTWYILGRPDGNDDPDLPGRYGPPVLLSEFYASLKELLVINPVKLLFNR